MGLQSWAWLRDFHSIYIYMHICVYVCVHTQLLSCVQLFVTYPMDCKPGYSDHGISQARILEWVAVSYSRGSNQPGRWTASPALAGRFFTTVLPGKPISFYVVWSSPSKVLCDQKTWKVSWGQRWVEQRGAWFKVSDETKGVPPAQSSFLPKAFPAKSCLYQASDLLTAQVPMPSRSSWFFFLNWFFFSILLYQSIFTLTHTLSSTISDVKNSMVVSLPGIWFLPSPNLQGQFQVLSLPFMICWDSRHHSCLLSIASCLACSLGTHYILLQISMVSSLIKNSHVEILTSRTSECDLT